MTENSESVWVVAFYDPVCFSDCICYTVELHVYEFVILCFSCPKAKWVSDGHQFTPSTVTRAIQAHPSHSSTIFKIYIAKAQSHCFFV